MSRGAGKLAFGAALAAGILPPPDPFEGHPCPTKGCDSKLVREHGTRILLCPSCDAPVARDPNPWPKAPEPPR